jgi:hypothetical protein
VSLAVEAFVIAGGVFLGRMIARLLHRRRAKTISVPRADDDGGATEGETADPLAEFVCKLGDVVVRRFEGDEAWLAGALVLAESRPVAALFVAPDAQGERAVFVHAASGTAPVWLTPLAADEVALSGDPPPAIEHAGTHFQRTRRLPVLVERIGSGAPDVGDRAVVGEYAGSGAERMLILVGTRASLAWRGVSLTEGQYDVLPGGKATLLS